ncbi:MAG: ATP-binding protein [Lachnospiraceae bacterium]|nr:ATP-binding protein [Lachnospiraceae bacterium]
MFNSYNDLKKEYEYIRQNDYLAYDEKKEKIYKDNPLLKDLDLKMLKLYFDIATLNREKKDASNLESQLSRVKSEREDYLKEHNIKDDYKEIKYVCEKCKDTGYVDGHKCSCFIQKEIEMFDNISHFRNYIKTDNFNNLNLSYYNQSGIEYNGVTYRKLMESLIERFKEQARDIEKKPFSLLLIGATGTGKTFLARCIGAEVLKNNKSVLYVNVNEYLSSLKPDYDGEPLKNYAIACDLFILDDLGTERSTEYTNVEINYIIDKRLNDKKSTIITTNYTPDDIESTYLSSTSSRLINAYDIEYLYGNDLRRLKNVSI